VATAAAAFVARRQPRVAWVRDQSIAMGEMVRLPPPVRDTLLRDHGVQGFHDRFGPLRAEP
jgi:hypothetical protein